MHEFPHWRIIQHRPWRRLRKPMTTTPKAISPTIMESYWRLAETFRYYIYFRNKFFLKLQQNLTQTLALVPSDHYLSRTPPLLFYSYLHCIAQECALVIKSSKMSSNYRSRNSRFRPGNKWIFRTGFYITY